MIFQSLLIKIDYFNILSSINSNDIFIIVSAKRIFKFSFDSVITSTTHANLNITNIYMIDYSFYIQT